MKRVMDLHLPTLPLAEGRLTRGGETPGWEVKYNGFLHSPTFGLAKVIRVVGERNRLDQRAVTPGSPPCGLGLGLGLG